MRMLIAALLVFGTNLAFADDYFVWPNGGGRVHKEAKVHESAYISKGSTVTGNVQIGHNVLIQDSELRTAGGYLVYVEHSSTIRNSTLVGSVFIRNNVNIEYSDLVSHPGEGTIDIGTQSLIQFSYIYSGSKITNNGTIIKSTIADGSKLSGDVIAHYSNVRKSVVDMGAILRASHLSNCARVKEREFIEERAVTGTCS